MAGVTRLFTPLTLLLLIIASNAQSAAPQPTTAPPAATVEASASPSCISQTEYDAALQKIESLQKSLVAAEAVEDELAQVTAQLESVSVERSACNDASASLFQRAKELEEVKGDLQSDLEAKSSEISSCKSEVESLSHSSAALSSCQAKILSAQANLEQCTEQSAAGRVEAETALKKLREKEASFQSDVQNLKALMQRAEAKYQSEKAAVQAGLEAAKKELIKANTRLEKVAQDSYLFSFAQFKRTMAKVAAFNKALVVFISAKVEPLLPPTLSEDVQMYYTQAKLASMGVYKTHMEPHVNTVSAMASPHVATLRKLYSEHAAEPVDHARQTLTRKASTVWDDGKSHIQKYSQLAGDWAETVVIEPFVKTHPAVQELIPDAPIDRFFAVIYLVAIMFIIASVIRMLFYYGIRPVLRILKCIVFMPCRVMGCVFGSCRKSKQVATKTVKKEIKKENGNKKDSSPKKDSPKKDEKKETPKKGTKKA